MLEVFILSICKTSLPVSQHIRRKQICEIPEQCALWSSSSTRTSTSSPSILQQPGFKSDHSSGFQMVKTCHSLNRKSEMLVNLKRNLNVSFDIDTDFINATLRKFTCYT